MYFYLISVLLHTVLYFIKTANSLPEGKREKWPPELPPLSGFLLFFVMCYAICHAMCMFFNFNLQHPDLRSAISNVVDLK